MQERIPPLQWTPSGGIILEENATTSVKAEKNVLVVAGPGAGKTELLAQKTGYLFQTNICTYPKKILAISFKTDAAANLKERIESRYEKNMLSDFLLSLTMRLQKRFWINLEMLYQKNFVLARIIL